MSFTSPVYGEYGNTVKGADYEMFWSKTHATVRFQGYLTTATGNKFLKRTNGAQALYIPTETQGSMVVRGCLVDLTNEVPYSIYVAAGGVFENDGGSTSCTLSVTAIDTDVLITAVANDTLDCIEIGVLESSGTRDVFLVLDLDLYWLNTTYKAMLTPSRYPAAGTATVSAAE
jgi:hypothetical protein